MTRRQKDPLRPLTDDEHSLLEQISRARSEPASHVERAKLLLAVAAGESYTAAARAVGRRSNDAVATLVTRFKREGLAALAPRMAAVPSGIMGQPSAIAFWPRCAGRPIEPGMEPRDGPSVPYKRRCAQHRMGSRASAPSRFGACCATPATPGNATGRGVQPGRRCGSASVGQSPSRIPMPRQKNVDRAGLPARCGPWFGGVVRRRSRSLPNRAIPERCLAAGRSARAAGA